MSAPPQARVIEQRAGRAIVRCPLCAKVHVYSVTYPGLQRRAPQCGQFRSPEQRAAGIVFHIDQKGHTP